MPRQIDVCTICTETKEITARGMCRACYSRWRRGKPEGYVREFKDRVCTVEGCDTKQHGQGLCLKHLQRLRRTGTTDEGRKYTRASEASFIHQHELYPLWVEFKRKRYGRKVTAEWAANFEVFITDVGERPSRRHRLYPVDRERELGPANFQWRESLLDKDPDESTQDFGRRLRKARKELHGTYYDDSDLRKRYGPDFGIRELRVMAETQKHLCAICGEPEKEERNGLVRHLAVDHCHATNRVRQLLCQSCNKGLGYFRDRPTLLALASAYLIKHGTNPAD